MFEMLTNTIGIPSNLPKGLPGPDNLIAGDDGVGFFGELTSSEFVTGTGLYELCGLTGGQLITDDAPWLKLAYNGNIQYMPRLPLYCRISWNMLNAAGVVYPEQNKLVVIKGITYRVRLIRGSSIDPASGTTAIGSEYNMLMYGLLRASGNPSSNPGAREGPRLANYETADFQMNSFNTIPGTCFICQEKWSASPTVNHLQRSNGSGGYATMAAYSLSSVADHSRSWRPILEYVSGL